MSTTVTVVTPSPAPAGSSSTLSNILNILNLILPILAQIPGLGLPIQIEQALQKIFSEAYAAYNAQTGKPLDLTLIPLETKLPPQ
jgi:hypothetical protein